MNKSLQLQIRVTPAQKKAIQRAARRAEMTMSDWILARVVPDWQQRFQGLTADLAAAGDADKRYVLAEIHDLLAVLRRDDLVEIAMPPAFRTLTPYWRNYVAAMIETVAAPRGLEAPDWASATEPLAQPAFGSQLESLRLHLLKCSPAPFRRRNIFIDASVGDRV